MPNKWKALYARLQNFTMQALVDRKTGNIFLSEIFEIMIRLDVLPDEIRDGAIREFGFEPKGDCHANHEN